MTEIEQKALALVNEDLEERGVNIPPFTRLPVDINCLVLLHAIEQHEAFKREVSDAVERVASINCLSARSSHVIRKHLERFIIPKPVDPLVEAWIEATGNTVGMEPLNEALAKRGLKIVETGR